MNGKRIKLWDLPTRVFHWALVILIVAAYITGQTGGNANDWHARIGLGIVGLISFRIVWGFVGSPHSRFATFFPTPASLRAYLTGQWRGIGHNPLGAFSVFGLLALVALQLATGLFSNDDIAFNGPLYALVGKALSDRLTSLHGLNVNLLIALVVVHIGAILFYTHVRKDKLLKPMITGWKDVADGASDSAEKSGGGGGALAFIVAVLIALAAVYAASGVWLPSPPPPAAAAPATPAW